LPRRPGRPAAAPSLQRTRKLRGHRERSTLDGFGSGRINASNRR
jgi:hypothetical protein